MRIDINAFFGHWPYWPIPHTSGEDSLRLMDQFGIDQAAITSLRGMFGNWYEANAETLKLTSAHHDRLTPIASMSPICGGGAKVLRELIAQGFRGIRMYPLFLQGYSLRSPFAEQIAEAAGELGIPVIIPTRPMMNFRFATLPIDDIASLAARHPTTTFILSGPNYLSEFQSAIEALTHCANMLIEISCMQGFGAVTTMTNSVGEDRVLFGTGLPLHYPACNVAKLEHTCLTKTQVAAVSSENAKRCLGLVQ